MEENDHSQPHEVLAIFAQNSVMIVEYQHKTFTIQRYPKTGNRSLRAWSAADEFLLDVLADENIQKRKMIIANDRFGFLSTLLHNHEPFTVMSYRSQEKACALNLTENKLRINKSLWVKPLEQWPEKIDIGVIKIPKSLELYRYYLHELSQVLTEDGVIYAAFMTRFFSPKMVSIANEYFEEVEQTQAWKKSRLLILKKKKPLPQYNFIRKIEAGDEIMLSNYPGVFSAHSVDTASKLLIDNLQLSENDKRVLDLASGNGILAAVISKKFPSIEMHLLDDFLLAVESSKLNLSGNCHFHYNDNLDDFEPGFFDKIVSNPPFHFEYETNIEVALSIFKGASRCLKPEGIFQVVANRHLNYKTHLVKLFDGVEIIAENDKFIVYNCSKPVTDRPV